MLNKRGIGNEIDWLLGVGLFLLSVTFIFVFFKPGITPVYGAQTLLDIVQDGFNNETMWSITTVPIFIYPANNTYAVGGSFVSLSNEQINVSCGDSCATTPYNGISRLIQDKNKLNIEVYYVMRNSSDAPPSTPISENPGVACGEGDVGCGEPPGAEGVGRGLPASRIEEARQNYVHFERPDQMRYNLTSGPMLVIPARLEAGVGGQEVKTKYLLTVADSPINFFLDNLTSSTTLEACSKKNNASWPYSNGVAFRCPVIYELGLTETTSGTNLASFLNLNQTYVPSCGTGYECIKKKWSFPASKEFAIRVESLPISIGAPPAAPLQQFNFSFPSNVISPPQNINIFVRQFNSFILTDDGTRVPIKVRISIW